MSCGGSDESSAPPDVLDIAREQVAAELAEANGGETADDPSVAGSRSDIGSTVDPGEPAELPPPDPSTFEGANRIVNLWVGPDGATAPVDVWGRRTFTNGPILLAEEVPFGSASDYFAAPIEYSLVIVGTGAGPDGAERAGLFNAADGEQVTTIFTNADELGGVNAPSLFEVGSEQSPAPPADGTGLLVLYAPNVRAFSDELILAVGGDAFYVGDGTSTCRTQRIEATGTAASILGGTQQVELELAPGPARITLHPWFSPDECDQTPVLDVTVDVPADGVTWVLVYTPDGQRLDTITLPVDVTP